MEQAYTRTVVMYVIYITKHPIVTNVQKGLGQLVNKGQYLFPAYEQYASSTPQ